jgi:hypothetical protein
MGLLYGRAGRLTAKNGGFRRGQCCRWTNDGECDEPQVCAAGTDAADCTGDTSDSSNSSCDVVDLPFVAAVGVHYTIDTRAAMSNAYSQLAVLPPGASRVSQAVVAHNLLSGQQAVGFTAWNSGPHLLRVIFNEGTGALTAAVTAVGRALARAPVAIADGVPRSLAVHCFFAQCRHSYGGVPLVDGDGMASVLRLAVAKGTGYAFSLRLPPDQPCMHDRTDFRCTHVPGVHAALTVYDPDAADGAAGFPSLLAGLLGTWRATPKGHESFFAHQGCAADDRVCLANTQNTLGRFVTQVGGGDFGERLVGTWVSAVAGEVLLELLLNCDVPVFGDIGYPGCGVDDQAGTGIQGGNIACHIADATGTFRGSDGSRCAAALELAITADAYFTPGAATDAAPVRGHIERTREVEVGRAELEALAAEMFAALPPDTERTLVAPPTLDEMLVSGSEAEALLATMFTAQQQPHVTFPLEFHGIVGEPSAGNVKGGGHRRQLQSSGPQSQGDSILSGVRVSLKSKAPTELEARAALR